jgi:phosphodiesterase/alkaline phosphatase D-like protein
MLGEKSVQIRYRTNEAILSEVQISSDGKTFNRIKKSSQTNTEHLVLIDSLTGSNKYFYRIRLTATQFEGDSTYFFKTAPAIGSQEKFSVWTIGDMWPEGPYQKNVYEGFKKFIGIKYTNLFMTLGDNVYGGGSDSDFQKKFLQIYNRNTTTWETIDSDNTSAIDTDFVLIADKTGLANYKDGNTVIACRIYQLSI